MMSLLRIIMAIVMAIFIVMCSSKKTDYFVALSDNNEEDVVILLENEQTSLAINLFGGAFIDFHLKDNPINPLSWELGLTQMPKNNQKGAPFRGHFLCLGRWGSPTEGEIEAGIPHNGEQSNTFWTLDEKKTPLHIKLYNDAPLDGLTVSREVTLSSEASVFKVVETFQNINSIGRINNVVQHPTLGPPFLSKNTRIFSNAHKGFLQKFSFPEPEKYSFEWPMVNVPSENISMDFSRSDHGFNGVTTHTFNDQDTTGWIVAYSPENNLMFGYVWHLSEYPWLNVWHHEENGKMKAKGLEFGTTGIGRSYGDLLNTDTHFFGQPSYEYIDAGEKVKKHYYCFLMPTNSSVVDVQNILLTQNELQIEWLEKGKSIVNTLAIP